MTTSPIEEISKQDVVTQVALRELNNGHARETSFLTPEKWRMLVDGAFSATCFEGSAALLIAFDQDASYDNANFNWFRARYARFVYVDRIVVSESHRGKGVAEQMYGKLFEQALGDGHDRVVCEVNFDPPNPGSDAFHAKMGFAEVGRATLVDTGKSVRYLARDIQHRPA